MIVIIRQTNQDIQGKTVAYSIQKSPTCRHQYHRVNPCLIDLEMLDNLIALWKMSSN